jgi:Ca2+-binding EF-hand superfamily protein
MRNMTLQQFQDRQVAHLRRMDTDHDGRVSLAEWTAWHQAHPGRGGGQVDPARSFARLDLNHDGYITPDEMAAMAARRYARMQGGAPGMGPGGENPPPQPLGPQ